MDFDKRYVHTQTHTHIQTNNQKYQELLQGSYFPHLLGKTCSNPSSPLYFYLYQLPLDNWPEQTKDV